ncbi:MAG: hypothetical protein IPK24_06785 [Kineosporiaceae bacterium]|nr:hypothetical protein [Kineosporiaceae bacterium]MBK8075264.1 hypothetical protein [Kineosporiaceae bacterium]
MCPVTPRRQPTGKVAGLFNQAVAAGGDSARRPSIYVHQALVEESQGISLNTVRGQIHRAASRA